MPPSAQHRLNARLRDRIIILISHWPAGSNAIRQIKVSSRCPTVGVEEETSMAAIRLFVWTGTPWSRRSIDGIHCMLPSRGGPMHSPVRRTVLVADGPPRDTGTAVKTSDEDRADDDLLIQQLVSRRYERIALARRDLPKSALAGTSLAKRGLRVARAGGTGFSTATLSRCVAIARRCSASSARLQVRGWNPPRSPTGKSPSHHDTTHGEL